MDRTKLVTGAIIGKANLYEVKFYKSKSSFVKDIHGTFQDPAIRGKLIINLQGLTL